MKTNALALGLVVFSTFLTAGSAQNPPRPNTFMLQSIQAGSTTDIDNLRVIDLDTGAVVYTNGFSTASDATNKLNLFYYPLGGGDNTNYVLNGSMTRVVSGKLRLETTGFGANGSGGYDSHTEAEYAVPLPKNFLVDFDAIRLQWAGHFGFAVFYKAPTDSLSGYAPGGACSTNRSPALRLDVVRMGASGSWFQQYGVGTNQAFASAGWAITFPAPSGSLQSTHRLGMSLSNSVVRYYLDGALLNSANISKWIADGPLPARIALATAAVANGFVIGVNLTDGGYGYTNIPQVRIIGGGGRGAQAVAVMSNGVVTAVNVLNAGYGYTSTPVVAVAPPYISQPLLGSAAMTLLSFGDLAVGGSYQLQRQQAWYWTNQGASFTSSGSTRTQMVAGAAGTSSYRLVLTPAPSQAFATAQMVNGFLVGAAVTGGGSGYVSTPAVTIVGGGGRNATAVAGMSGGVVTGVAITSAGIGYTNTPTVRLAAPPAASLSPDQIPVVRLDAASLAPYENYQVQFKPAVGVPWENGTGGLFSPAGVTHSQYLYTSNSVGFFRLQYVP
jgi:hypothetical protein